MRKLLIAFAAVVVALVAVDRISVAVAENQISDRIEAAYGLPAKPGVSIQGFPFLSQVVTGDYSEIDVSASHVPAGGVTLQDLHARFMGVHASVSQVFGSGSSTVTADRATGTAIVAYAEVDRRLPAGLRLHPAGQGGRRLAVSGTVDYQGTRVPVAATVTLGVTAAGIKVTPVHITAFGQAGLTTPAQDSRFAVVVPVTALPLHLRLVSVRAGSGGLRIGAAARDVHFARA